MSEESWFNFQKGLETFSFAPPPPKHPLRPKKPPIQWAQRTIPLLVKWLSCEAYHSPPANSKVKNAPYNFMA